MTINRAAADSGGAVELAAHPWRYRAGPFRGLGHRFVIQTTEPQLGRYLDHVLVGLASREEPDMVYSLVTTDPEPWPYAFYIDEKRAAMHTDAWYVLDYLLWHINRKVVDRSTEFVLVHAAAVERDGVGVVLPGEMESGKTTLAAGLVESGFRYLTDEAAAFDPETLLIHPYAKALTIDEGSWPVLAGLRPSVHDVVRPFLRRQWHVPATVIRPDALAAPVTPRLIVSPRYEAGAQTRLVPVGRAELLAQVASWTFNFNQQPRRDLEVLGRAVRQSQCFRLTVGDLHAATRLLSDLVDDVSPPHN